MGKPRRWFGIGRRKFSGSSLHETVIIVHINTTGFIEDIASLENPVHKSHAKELSRDDVAAIKIQAFFRGHLARRAFQALKSLVKLQAMVRGVCVRKQARVALHCMHALARLQMTVRARQLVST